MVCVRMEGERHVRERDEGVVFVVQGKVDRIMRAGGLRGDPVTLHVNDLSPCPTRCAA